MQIIQHRRNTRLLLASTPSEFGVEIDLRSIGDRLIIQHDPYSDGEDFEAWLVEFRHQTLILNVKEEGLEARLLDLTQRYGIDDFFFLDQSIPFLIRTAQGGERRCAVRLSEFEPIEAALRFAGMVDWLWLDNFTGRLPSITDIRRAIGAGFRICLVSPELHGRSSEEITALRAHFIDANVSLTAVCTKVPEAWK